MIELSPDTAFLLYLGITLLVLLSAWIYHIYHSHKRKLSMVDYRLTVCEYCHFAYLGNKGDPVTRCPQCKSLNKTTT